MRTINALVLTGYGLNCDYETAYAFELAGAIAERVHINSLIDGSVSLEKFQIMAFVGGFSWGDDHGAGVIQSVRMKTNIGGSMLDFIEGGNLVIGICNGFQTLVNLGLLPGLNQKYDERTVALINNDCGNFRDQWVHLKVNSDSPCIFTPGLDLLELPVRHGEGKFFCEASILDMLRENGQIVMRYANAEGSPAESMFPNNPNGSLDDIAGICDPTGRVFGLMPHPEAYNHWTNHPDWPRLKEAVNRGKTSRSNEPTPGIQMFINAINYLRES